MNCQLSLTTVCLRCLLQQIVLGVANCFIGLDILKPGDGYMIALAAVFGVVMSTAIVSH